LRRNGLLKQVIEGQIEGKLEVAEGWERRSKQLLGDLEKRTKYCNLKKEALDRPLWRTCCGRGYGPIIRQLTE